MGKNTKNVAAFAVVAALLGYIAGLLTAPKSGKETRADIKDAAIRTKKELEKRLKKLYDDLNVLIDKSEVKLKELKGRSSIQLKQAIKKAKNAKEKAREVLSALHEGEADDKDLDEAVKELNVAMDNLKKYISTPKEN
jgi:gas vesicle protein